MTNAGDQESKLAVVSIRQRSPMLLDSGVGCAFLWSFVCHCGGPRCLKVDMGSLIKVCGECVTELKVDLTSCEYIPVRLGLSVYQGQVRRLADQKMGLESIGKQGPSSGPLYHFVQECRAALMVSANLSFQRSEWKSPIALAVFEASPITATLIHASQKSSREANHWNHPGKI